jgi:fatty acid desaturase
MSDRSVTGADLPQMAHANHGRTTAAWVATVGISVAALIAAIGVGAAAWTWVWVGSIVAVASLAAGAVLKALGHGQPSR